MHRATTARGEHAFAYPYAASLLRDAGVGVVPPSSQADHPAVSWARSVKRRLPEPTRLPVVVDLPSLRALPLRAQLLSALSASVVKVENRIRPDGARRGDPAFYDLLDVKKLSMVLDFSKHGGLRVLVALISTADIVIESTCPHALRQLGIYVEDIAARNPGLTWINLTSYDRGDEARNWIIFCGDVAVTTGLSSVFQETYAARLFAGDAITDPQIGLDAAPAVWADYCLGGGCLFALSLRDVVAHSLAADVAEDRAARLRRWPVLGMAHHDERCQLSVSAQQAPELCADTALVLGKLVLPC